MSELINRKSHSGACMVALVSISDFETCTRYNVPVHSMGAT
jgi:hypothetical protein